MRDNKYRGNKYRDPWQRFCEKWAKIFKENEKMARAEEMMKLTVIPSP